MAESDDAAGRGLPPCGGCGKRGVHETFIRGTHGAETQLDVRCRYCGRQTITTLLGTTPRDRADALANVEPPPKR